MTLTVVGPVLDRDGLCQKVRHYPDRFGSWHTERRQWSTPSAGVRRQQPAFVGIDVNHSGPWVGKVTHLERDANDRIWAVGTIDGFNPPGDTPLFFSPELEFRTHDGGDIEIISVAIVRGTAQLGARPLQFIRNGLDQRGQAVWRFPFQQRLLERARAYRPAGSPLIVAEPPPSYEIERLAPNALLVNGELVATRGAYLDYPDRRPPGQLEIRPCGPIISVR